MTPNIAKTFEENLQRHGLFHALAFLNGTTPYRFTGVYRFEGGVVKSVLLYDRKNPELRIGENVPWKDSPFGGKWVPKQECPSEMKEKSYRLRY